MRPPQPALFTTGHESPASSWHVLSPGWRAVCTQTSRPMADARMVRPVAEFDLSSAVGVGGLTAAAGIAIRSASCQQPRVAALVGAAAAIGLCAVARRHRRSVPCSSCSSCCSCCSCRSSSLKAAPEEQIPPTKLTMRLSRRTPSWKRYPAHLRERQMRASNARFFGRLGCGALRKARAGHRRAQSRVQRRARSRAWARAMTE